MRVSREGGNIQFQFVCQCAFMDCSSEPHQYHKLLIWNSTGGRAKTAIKVQDSLCPNFAKVENKLYSTNSIFLGLLVLLPFDLIHRGSKGVLPVTSHRALEELLLGQVCVKGLPQHEPYSKGLYSDRFMNSDRVERGKEGFTMSCLMFWFLVMPGSEESNRILTTKLILNWMPSCYAISVNGRCPT